MKLTDKAINRLFYLMRNMYGSYWVMMLGGRETPEIKEQWLKGLDKFTAELIGKVIEDLKLHKPDRPPNLKQFIAMVKAKKTQKAGHLSNKLWITREMSRCSDGVKNKHLLNIKQYIS